MKYLLILLFLFSTQVFANDGEAKESGFWTYFMYWSLGIFFLIGMSESRFVKHFFPNRNQHYLLLLWLLGILWTVGMLVFTNGFIITLMFLMVDFFLKIPAIYYFLSAIIVLLVMIFIRLNANKKRED